MARQFGEYRSRDIAIREWFLLSIGGVRFGDRWTNQAIVI